MKCLLPDSGATVTLSEVPNHLLGTLPATSSLQEPGCLQVGTNDPYCDRKVAKLIGPPNTSPCGKMSLNLEDGSIGPEYPDLNRTNEHKYYLYW